MNNKKNILEQQIATSLRGFRMFFVSHFFPASYPNFPKVSQQGSALLLFTILFLVASLTLVLSIGRGVYDDLVSYRILESGKASFYGAEAGIEDAVYRHRQAKNYSNSESFSINDVTVTMTRTTIVDTFEILAEGDMNDAIRRSEVNLVIGGGASFNFGMQGGNGGIFMENNSAVRGNVFANGAVRGANNNIVYGDVISAGSGGLTDTVHATGSVWANTITSATVDGDAYYQTLTGTLVFGSTCISNTHCHPGSPDQATATMPITDAQIDEWKVDAAAGTVIASTSPACSSGTYTIGADTTIGPMKIECNLKIQNNSTDVYLQGSVWVVGNIDIKNSPNLRVDASVSGKNIAIISDKPTDRHTSSKIVLQNNAIFSGFGTNSNIFLISQNDSAEDGGSEVAINMKNNATGALLLYAAHGEILIENGSGIKSVTGYYIHTKNNTEIIYESGLASLLFTTGPGGGYTLTSWHEIE